MRMSISAAKQAATTTAFCFIRKETNPAAFPTISLVSGSAEVDVGTLNALEVGTVSGQVKVTGAIADSASCQLNGYSGQIVLTVPPGSPGHFELQSATGSLQSDLPEIQRSSKAMEKRAVFARGEGGPRCRMENFSGKLAVRDGH